MKGRRIVKSYMALGKGVHVAAEHDNKAKKDKGVGIHEKEARDISVSAYDEAFKKDDDGKEPEVTESKDDIGRGRDLAASGGGAFIQLVSPRITSPLAIELPVLASYEAETGPVEVAGVIDLAVPKGGEAFIEDLKTGKRKKSADYAHGKGQLTSHGILYKAATGVAPVGYAISDLHHGKKGWSYQRLETTRTEEDFASWWKRMLAVNAAVLAGSFPPAAEGSWQCSPNFCEFFGECPYVASRRRYLKEVEDGE